MTFDVIYADPPWKFQTKNTGGKFKSGAAHKYPCMDLAAIQALPVPVIAGPAALLFLWVPTRLKFSHGGPTLAAWGFSYETTIYWDKQRQGMGYWFRNYVEELLVAVKPGVIVEHVDEELLVASLDAAPTKCQLPNIVHCRPGEHSEKPEVFRQIIEQASGRLSRRHCVELFARKQAPGWTCIGNMVTGNDIRTDLRQLAVAA